MLLLDLIDNHGNTRSLWGYGVPRVMGSGVPSLLPIRKLFPHIPAAAFEALESKEVDVLIGLTMMEIQPAGGMGVDRVGGVTALRSQFGCGWCPPRTHPHPNWLLSAVTPPTLSTPIPPAGCISIIFKPIRTSTSLDSRDRNAASGMWGKSFLIGRRLCNFLWNSGKSMSSPLNLGGL